MLLNEVTDDCPDVPRVRDAAAQLEKRYRKLIDDVDEAVSAQEAGTQRVMHFNNDLKSLTSQLGELEDDLEHMAPIGRDEDTLTNQKETTNALAMKLNESAEHLDDVEAQCKDLVDASHLHKDDLAVAQTETARKHHTKLCDR